MERYVIIGLGLFGRQLAMGLSQAGADVIAVDSDRELVESVRDHVALAVCMDCTAETALRSQGIDQVDTAIVAMGQSFEAAVLVTALLKQLGVNRVISRASGPVRAEIMLRVGADFVVDPEQEAADRWTNRLLLPAMLERTVLSEGFSLVQYRSPSSFHGRTLGELDIRKNYEVNVVGIRRPVPDEEQGHSETVISVPMANTKIEPEDVLLVIGHDENIAHLPKT
jgi:trk system potassium uptake protein TrkA